MATIEILAKFFKDDTKICIVSEKSCSIIYSGSVGECPLGIAKLTNFLSFYPYLVDDSEIGLIVALTDEYRNWQERRYAVYG